mmetsp:Transcript_6846/g.11519  ORF Transcript_6846/g.11519 Transcript_6846/m.11519 type:complete len:111 (+) Transcript_6846:88-420(+)
MLARCIQRNSKHLYHIQNNTQLSFLKSASHHPVIAGETTNPNTVTNINNEFKTRFAAIVSPISDALSLILESFPSAAHSNENGNPWIDIARRNIGKVTGLVRLNAKFLIN